MRELGRWTHKDPARVYNLLRAVDYAELVAEYGGAHPSLIRSILAHADRKLGARSVLVEYRYIDIDYRSEYSRFYSTTYQRYPSVTHRLHFFADDLDENVVDPTRPSSFQDRHYLGYVVMRPVEDSSVGRMMLAPAPELAAHVACKVNDEVNLFGSSIGVTASPFMGQDFQLGVCVHAAAWVCAYYHHLRFGAPRILPSDISAAAPMGVSRLVPSNGLTVTQLARVLDAVGLPPVVYDLANLPDGETIASIACRYLDSSMPVVVGGGRHSFVLVGYRWVRQEGKRRVQFIRQDDLSGPYQIVENIALDQYRPWQHIVAPLPRKVYMSAERAERLGEKLLQAQLRESKHPTSAALLADLMSEKPKYEYRASVHRSNEFKAGLVQRRPPEVTGLFQWLQLSRWVWVVELVARDDWYNNRASVVAEVLIDATDHGKGETLLGWRIPGVAACVVPDYGSGSPDLVALQDLAPLESVVRTNTGVVDLSPPM